MFVFSDDFYTKLVRFMITMNINKDVANLTIFQFHVDVFCLRRTAFELLSGSWIKGPFEPAPSPPPTGFLLFHWTYRTFFTVLLHHRQQGLRTGDFVGLDMQFKYNRGDRIVLKKERLIAYVELVIAIHSLRTRSDVSQRLSKLRCIFI